MTGENKVSVEMSENEQKLYFTFCQHYSTIKLIIDNGGFSVRKRTVELHFDGNQLMDIFIRQHPFNRPEQIKREKTLLASREMI